jgi:hypothetical protein
MTLTFDMIREDFSIFTTIFLVLSAVNLSVCITYSRYYFKYKHIKAKDVGNLWLIFLSGQCQSWGKYFYSIPFYEDTEGYTTMCLVIGYILQHILGSCILFYCMMMRLIKYGAIFRAFDRFKCCMQDISAESWSMQRYKQLFMTRYKVILAMTSLIMLIPMSVFVGCVYTIKAIYVNEETGYCETDANWKLIFICINLFYFVTLVFTLCFVPKFIKRDQFNESMAMRDSVIYTMVIFGVEIWINFREEFVSMPWIGISGLIIFSIHTFIIARLFWFRAFQACKGNDYYETTFTMSSKDKSISGQHMANIITANREDPVVTSFLSYCQEHHSDDVHEVRNQQSLDTVTKMTVNTMIRFTIMCKDMELLLEHEKVSKGNSVAFGKYQEICTKFVNKDELPLTYVEHTNIINATNETLSVLIFQKHYKCMMTILYQQYLQEFMSTEIAARLSDDIRQKAETTIGIDAFFDSEWHADIPLSDFHTISNSTQL